MNTVHSWIKQFWFWLRWWLLPRRVGIDEYVEMMEHEDSPDDE
jgi:hypothetical protein